MLEVGCGDRGGVVRALVDAGYDTIGVDPRAPQGERFYIWRRGEKAARHVIVPARKVWPCGSSTAQAQSCAPHEPQKD